MTAEVDRYRPLLPVWSELARRLRRGDVPTRLSLSQLSLDEQAAIADTLGLDRLPGAQTRIAIERLATALRVDGLDGLTRIAEAILGPIVDQSEVRRQGDLSRAALWNELADDLAVLQWVSPDALVRFIDHQRVAGVGADGVDDRRTLHHRLVAVLAALPTEHTSRAVFAAQVLGDPHALDATTALARLATSAIAAFRDLAVPDDAEADRAVWENVGVMTDQVSSTVLVLGLRTSGDHALAGQLNPAADAGEPVLLTLSQLRRWPLSQLGSSDDVLVVENPSIVEWAAHNGSPRLPLICSSGVPTVAVRTLLRQLAGGGATLLQHADFDPAGLYITRWLKDNAGTTPWRMSSNDYERAVAELSRSASRGSDHAPITQPTALPATPWDPRLQVAMDRHRRIVFEEQLLPTLFDD